MKRTSFVSLLWVMALLSASSVSASGHVRFDNDRISEVFQYALKRSASFQALLETLNLTDRVIYVEEGRCSHRTQRSCLALMSTPGTKNLLIRIDPRQPIRSAVAQLAHELYHAAEVAREPDVTDAVSLRQLYSRIGESACFGEGECWETRAAVAFEALVTREISR